MSRMRIYKTMDMVNIILPEDFADIINDMGAVDNIHLKYEERGKRKAVVVKRESHLRIWRDKTATIVREFAKKQKCLHISEIICTFAAVKEKNGQTIKPHYHGPKRH